ncbi:hypothetical protein PTSG_13222 [Salpingoeca rosetta]|uniref:Uncharacterized protein n=1 Tax=Salpingoeca rosetta (strain ATCC 50818 / BSB-021) TaxID=946362 RepID=F2UTM9_SALR5|nr:uncharacterized protein PTSG_13222 [Salpingoeca rosetta]EGD73378.1 hypothetical protein PTSG_13222 [Salpingoeca rosetta]|eukprot:XP_004987475.1 hypothetical protein PTSG_13222 [Salpingoeca rosetta]
MMFSMDSEGASQSLRRDSQLSITVTFTDPPEPTLLAGGSPGYVIPDTRYSLQFEVDTTTDDLPTTTTSTTTTTTTTTAATTTITTTAAGAGGAGNSTITNSTAITTTNSTSASNATAISTTSTTTTTLEPTTTMTTLEDMVRSRALRALNDIGIPIIDISIDGTKVSVVAVEFPTSSMMMDLDDHPYVALNTTRPPLTLNSALTAEDAIELALRLVQAHVVQPRWGSFEFPVELLESAFTTTTTTTTTTSTTTTTTTSPTSQDNSSSTTPTQSPDAPKASSSTAASPWQFAVGAFGGVVLIAAIVGFIMVTRRRSVVGTSPTVVSDIKQRPTVSFTNPVYEDGLKKDATMHSHNGDLYTDVGDRDEQLYDEPAALFGTTHQVFNPIYSAKSTENVFGDDEDEDEVDPDGGYLDVSEQAQDVAEYTDVHVAADDDATYATGFGFSDDEDE